MNPGTAQGRLVKDLLFKFVLIHYPNCYHCGKPLTRETFSIEHKTPWLDSDDPVGLFFDLNNVDFSHLSCNSAGARPSRKKYFTEEDKVAARDNNNKRWRATIPPEVRAAKRRERYLATGR